MIRFLFGVVLGVVVAGLGLSTIAVLNPKPDGPIANSGLVRAPEAAPAAVPDPEPAPEPEPEPDPEPTPEPAPEPAPQPEPEPEPEPEQQQGAAAPAAPQPAQLPALTSPVPGTGGAPDTGETATLGAPSVETGSNAGIGGSTDTSPARTVTAPTQIASAATGADSGPSVNTESAAVPEIASSAAASALIEGTALQEFAAPFDGSEGKPLMAIVLIDEGEAPVLRPGMAALNEPVTFGVLADLPDAAQVAGRYRESGFEVAAVAPTSGALSLGTATGPEAVNQTLASIFQKVPGAASFMDGIDGPLPSNTRLAENVIQALAFTGHGLVSHRGNGLSAVPPVAEGAGVPAEVVYRVIDAEAGSAAITQALERAVEDAERNGKVIVVGHVRQETIATLSQWMFGASPGNVSIAPVSAVLTQ